MSADVVQAEGLYAMFLCQLSTSGSIEWQINGTSLQTVNTGELR